MEGPRAGTRFGVILGIETSCDETAAALVTNDGRVLANVVSSQAELHAPYGGVVPEVASRHHLELILPALRQALADADAELGDVEAVGVTQGPGLIGALLVGLSAAKALAWARRLPLIPVNHLHGHVASLFTGPGPVNTPFLCLLASGGHTLLLDVRDRGAFEIVGTTVDDAAGEAFDKGARLLGLGYPGGAEIDRLARDGDPEAFSFPVARMPVFDFSFSGLKTALLYQVRACTPSAISARRLRRARPTSPRPISGRSSALSSSGRVPPLRRQAPSGLRSWEAWPRTQSCAQRCPRPRPRRWNCVRTTPQ